MISIRYYAEKIKDFCYQYLEKLSVIVSLIIVISIVAVIAITLGVKNQINFTELYEEYCESTWAEVGDDGSYLSIDTNPFDYKGIANFEAYTAIENVNEALDLPDSLLADMKQTTGLMGIQTEEFDDIGIVVKWNYHPDKGLEVTYKLAN